MLLCRAFTNPGGLAATCARPTFYKTLFRSLKMTCVIPNSLQSFGMIKGQIQVIFGPMFSGKTTELIRRLKRYQIANYRCLIVRYANDNRFRTDSIATHDNQTLPAVTATKLEDLRLLSHDYDVIGIDEGQFFIDCVPYAEAMANNGKIVIVAALDGTFQRVGFGDILNLVPLSESVVKLTAVCMSCFSDASYTKRISNEKQVEIIGGVDKYMAVCRQCHAQTSPQKRSPFKEVNQDVCLANAPRKNLFKNGNADENCHS